MNAREPKTAAQELLLADLQHFGESLWRNEEVGEKRFTFFVTLVTAVLGGLAAIVTVDRVDYDFARNAAGIGAGALFIIGFVTYLRVLQRNKVTDEYKVTLKYIRTLYVAAFATELRPYDVPRKPRKDKERWTGGYAETIGVINGTLATAAIVLLGSQLSQRDMDGIILSIGAGTFLVITGAHWWYARRDGRTRTNTGMYFRAGAGAVILDERHERVLVLERSDKPEAWQLPQGGIEAGEDPYTAALREVREETGLAAEELALIDRYPEPLVYELPPEHQTAKTGLGQVQYWFLFECKRTPAVIELPDRKEFRAVEWLTFPDLLVKVVEFRRPVYHRLYKHFERHLVARTPQI